MPDAKDAPSPAAATAPPPAATTAPLHERLVTTEHKLKLGKRSLDFNVDPPPDIVVEIDLTNASQPKFPIYATLGVPEIWRYDGEQAYIYQLTGQAYAEVNDSLAFPSLTAAALTDFIAQSKTQGQTAALLASREWWRSHSSFTS